MTAETRLTILDRAHTLLVIALGSAAAIFMMTLPPRPQTEAAQFTWLLVSLVVGYGIAYITDVVYAALLGRLRGRLRDAIREEQTQRDAADAQRMDDAVRASEERSARFWADYEATHGSGSVDRH